MNENSIIRYRSEAPILSADRPWEEGASLRAISVIPEEDEDRMRLYYLTWHRGAFTKNALCVAYTQDGFNWEKPDLGEGNNIVMRGSGRALDWGVFFPQQIRRTVLAPRPAAPLSGRRTGWSGCGNRYGRSRSSYPGSLIAIRKESLTMHTERRFIIPHTWMKPGASSSSAPDRSTPCRSWKWRGRVRTVPIDHILVRAARAVDTGFGGLTRPPVDLCRTICTCAGLQPFR